MGLMAAISDLELRAVERISRQIGCLVVSEGFRASKAKRMFAHQVGAAPVGLNCFRKLQRSP